MTTKLKPCPFCGNEEAVIFKDEDACQYVVCERCDAEGPGYSTKREAIAAWNRRKP